MDVTKYPYSIFQNIFSMVLVLGTNAFFLFMVISFPALPGSVFLGAMLLCVVALGIYLFRKFFLPLLMGKIALELDDQKLQFNISNRVIYWKDIETFTSSSLNHGGWIIKFTLKDGSKVNISTKYIAGADTDIYNSLVDYFEKYKR